MLGALTGDTIGSVYEFHNTKEYNFPLFDADSNYTDDSVMTMAVAYWLLTDKKHSYQKLEDAMVTFAEHCPPPMGGFGAGFCCWLFFPKELHPYDDQYGESPYQSTTVRHPYGSWGNGSAMRVSAVGWCFDTLEETERIAKMTAEITHNHPEGIKGAQATAAAIFLARTGKSKEEIRDYIEKTYGYDLHKTWEDWHWFTIGNQAAKVQFLKPSSHSWTQPILRTPSAKPSPSAATATRLPASPEASPKLSMVVCRKLSPSV